ncbi:MAG: hypothetical protein JWP89_3516 [Schlesneria sp.]|nr:hypothetical protein [Schlesneria sp.]
MSLETILQADLAQSGVSEATVQAILQALNGLRFGQVTVIVQDGRVMQIDRTDRFRLPAEPTRRG